MAKWWQLQPQEVAQALETDLEKGLSLSQIPARQARYGLNQLQEKQQTSALEIFFEQFKDFIVWVLIAAALVSGFMQEWIDALAIILIVILNAILGFVQEFRAEKALAALKKLSSPQSAVIRSGTRMSVPAKELVPGDIIELEAGSHIPADSRIAYMTGNFATLEASLTGESTPVAKTLRTLQEDEVPLADRANIVYMGTSVSSGKAKAVVVATGMHTELGKIAGMIGGIEKESTPLQKKLVQFGKKIVYICFVLVAAVFVLGIMRGGKILDMFLTSVSLAVAAIPEGLPAVVTIALALGVHRMVKRNALIRKLPSVETLGCATVICSDKTGTLTKNEMTVQALYAGGRLFNVTGIGYAPQGEFLLDGKPADTQLLPDVLTALECGVLCNAAQLVEEKGIYRIAGDPTEGALLTAAAKLGVKKELLESDFAFIEEIPFDSERKKMTMVRQGRNRVVAYVKGAPDILLKDCLRIQQKGMARDLLEADKKEILKVNDELSSLALRVLAVAYRDLTQAPAQYDADSIEKDLVFVGLIAMIDPPRPEAKEAIIRCRSAGIKTVMITGDHKATAVAIAKELGFFGPDSLAITGEELDKLTDAQLRAQVGRAVVYARVSPEHKLRVVRTLRGQNEVVAMTGDGVNDAPAVKEADIGVAMGITGTDVTKEVSDMVVTDDNFASIVAAVEEGRGIYDNIKKFIHYLLSCNTGEILVMFVSSLIGLPVPLLPMHILWVNLVTDGLPALALGVDPVDPQIMKRPPRPVNEPVITGRHWGIMIAQGSFIALCSLLAFCFVLWVEKEGIERARTAAFIVLATSQLFHSFNCRSMTESLFSLGILTNTKLVLANAISFLLLMAVVYVPVLQTLLKTRPLGFFDWILVIGISSFPLWAMEGVKVFLKFRRRPAP